MLLPTLKLCSRVFFHSDGSRTFSGVCDTEVCSYHPAGTVSYRSRSMYNFKKVGGNFVKIVVVKAPKFLRGILKSIFGIKEDKI